MRTLVAVFCVLFSGVASGAPPKAPPVEVPAKADPHGNPSCSCEGFPATTPCPCGSRCHAICFPLGNGVAKAPPVEPSALVQKVTPDVIPGYRPVRFDGAVWIYEREVSRAVATPFVPPPGFSTTPTTPVRAGVPSTSSSGIYRTGSTFINVGGAVTSGGTNCGTLG